MLLDSKDRARTNAPLAKGESRGIADETEASSLPSLSTFPRQFPGQAACLKIDLKS